MDIFANIVEALKACVEIDDALKNSINDFTCFNFDQETQQETLSLVKAGTDSKGAAVLRERFSKRLEFGTAGLRAGMGSGFNRMNVLTVMQTTQGLAQYLLNKFGSESCQTRGVIIGYDGRKNSKRFANVCAAVFLSKGFKIFLNSKVTATPLNPYGILKYKCLAGVQVTASHNPKNDNGYKLYADNGAQIVPPVDEEISELILKNLKPWNDAMELLNLSTGYLKDDSLVIDPYDELYQLYMKEMTEDLCLRKSENEASKLKIVYTAMHGVGFPFTDELLKRFGFKNLFVVEEQKFPDPEFSTVSFPNPEEKGALNLAIDLANKVGAPIVIANDPDADRFACAEKQPDDTWKVLHGDEIGILFGWRMLELSLMKNIAKEELLFICSAVSSRMLQKMVVAEGSNFEETMTGFKWMMNKALELSNKYKTCFVYEEALGYAVNMKVPDKDGVSASAVWVEMACELHSKGETLTGKLDELRKKYGYFVTSNSYFLCYDPAAIKCLFDEFRNNGSYKWSLGDFKISRIRDVTKGYDSAETDDKCKFPTTPTAQMITLFFENSATLTLRTSGTEPKLKWYSELGGTDPETTKIELEKIVKATIQHFMQPHKYPLETPLAK